MPNNYNQDNIYLYNNKRVAEEYKRFIESLANKMHRPYISLTLTFRDFNEKHDNISKNSAIKMCSKFLDNLDATYCNKGTKIDRIVVLEGNKYVRRHFHLLISLPEKVVNDKLVNIDFDDFIAEVKHQWEYGKVKSDDIFDVTGWSEYISKIYSKEFDRNEFADFLVIELCHAENLTNN